MPLRVIFAGTPQFAVPTLQGLIDSSHRIVAVYTQPDRPAGRGRRIAESRVKLLARCNGIPIIQAFSLRNDEKEQEKLIAINADIMVVASYGLILPQRILTAFQFGCVNLHASLLPRWRGSAPIQRSILEGDQETGVSIIQMNESLDTGNILAKKACTIFPKDRAIDLHDRLALLGANVLLQILDKLEHSDIQSEKQDSKQATYASKIQKREAQIDWSKSAFELGRQVRAFNPVPVAFTFFEKQSIRVWQAEVINEKTELKPGVLVGVGKNGVDIATGQGILRLHQLQLPGKRICLASDFISAYHNKLTPKKTVFGN